MECSAIRNILKTIRLAKFDKQSVELFWGQQAITGHRLLKTLFTYRVLPDTDIDTLRKVMQLLADVSFDDLEALRSSHRLLLWFAQRAVSRLQSADDP